MALSIRFVPKTGRANLHTHGGHDYPTGGSATVDVPYDQALAIHDDQAIRLMVVGTTAERPGNDPARTNWPPRVMYDSTLGKPIFLVVGSNPAAWVDINGASV
jgi:hypothetical protein